MSCKNLVLAICFIGLVAVCAAKGNHGKAKDSSDAASAKAFNPFDIVKNILNPTTRASSPEMLAITKAASAAVTTVDSVASKITGMIDRAKGVQSMTKSVVQETIDGVLSRAQSLARKQGGQPGCVTEMMGRTGALGMQFALNELECPGNKIDSLENMGKSMVEAGQTLLTMVPKAALSLDSCERKGGPFEMICRAKIVTDLTGRAGSIAMKAGKVLAESITMAATIAPSLATCAGVKVGTVAGQAANLVSRLGACSGSAVKGVMG